MITRRKGKEPETKRRTLPRTRQFTRKVTFSPPPPYSLPLPPSSSAQKHTIYALSTPSGKGGVAVIRISGPDALQVYHKIVRSHKTGKPFKNDPEPWKLRRCRIIHPDNGGTIDDGMVVYFKAPYSYTTLPSLELHVHSGRAIISSLLASLALPSAFPTLRPAEPGEFTRQALLGGRLDLTMVEGLRDLIDADTEVQRVWALEGAAGETKRQYDALRAQVIHCLAHVEALIDFGEGEDIEEGVYEQVKSLVTSLLSTIRAHLSDSRRGELVRSGIKLTIFGPPNAGKSSLFNYLANRPASIVTPLPGTTRDVLELTLDIGGLPVVVADTAGLRGRLVGEVGQSVDVVEEEGVRRGVDRVQNADIALCVLPLPDVLLPPSPSCSSPELESSKKIRIKIPTSIRSLITKDTFFLFNKIDLVSSSSFLSSTSTVSHGHIHMYMKPVDGSELEVVLDEEDIDQTEQEHGTKEGGSLKILAGRAWTASIATNEGTQAFVNGLAGALRKRFNIHDASNPLSVNPQEKLHAPLITRERHRVHLEEAARYLEAFLELSEPGLSNDTSNIVLGAEELRYAARALGKVTGEIGTEEVLDRVFRDFCIGK